MAPIKPIWKPEMLLIEDYKCYTFSNKDKLLVIPVLDKKKQINIEHTCVLCIFIWRQSIFYEEKIIFTVWQKRPKIFSVHFVNKVILIV